MLEVLVRRHYREFDLHGLRVLDNAGRPAVVADYVLDENRPTHLVSTVGTIEELRRPERAAGHGHRGAGGRPARGSRGRRRPLPLLARRATGAGGDQRGAGDAGRWRCPSPPTYAGSRSRSARAAGEPGQLLHVPPGAGWRRRRHRDGRGRPGPRHPPDGRPTAEPVAAARLSTSPGSRHPRTCCSTTARPRATPPTSGWSPSRRCASSPSSATPRARSPRSPTRSVPSRTASRRSGGPAPSAAPRARPST